MPLKMPKLLKKKLSSKKLGSKIKNKSDGMPSSKEEKKGNPSAIDDIEEIFNAPVPDNSNLLDNITEESEVLSKPKVKGSKKASIKLSGTISSNSEIESVQVIKGAQSASIHNFGLSKSTIDALLKRGVESLFPIQVQTFKPIRNGEDLIGRAKTGQGKTLAFCLPTLEQIISKGLLNKGKAPKVLIMTPTRELAKQVVTEFQSIAPFVKIEAIYGGTSLQENRSVLMKGIDVVVGTPGRIKVIFLYYRH
jgi:ATP-dependent RNA helicase DDX21